MPATETFKEVAKKLEDVSEETGRYQMKVRILRWIQKHRGKLGEELKESLLKEIA